MKHTAFIPLKPGRISIADQAAARGLAVPIGKSVAQLRADGYDVDADWDDNAVMCANPASPTGYEVRSPWSENVALWALAH